MPAPWNGNFCVYRKRAYRKRKSGLYEGLVQKSETTLPEYQGQDPQDKWPGGKKKPFDKDTFETAARELWEETGLVVTEEARVKFLLSLQVGAYHFQDYFAVPFEDCGGILRTEIAYGENTKLYPPRFEVINEELIELLYKNHGVAGIELAEYLGISLLIAA